MTVCIVYILEEIEVDHHDGCLLVVLLETCQSIVHLCLDLTVIKDLRERILDRHLFILLKSTKCLLGILVDILDHEDESVIVINKCLRAAENKLYPDVLAFKITHQAVVG